MANLKERILKEMILTNEDKLIFEILKENPQLQLEKYEKMGREAYGKLVIKKCKKCKKYQFPLYHAKRCPHIYEPVFTKDWKFKCFIKMENK